MPDSFDRLIGYQGQSTGLKNSYINKTALKKETLYRWRTGFRHEPCGLEPMIENFKGGEKSNKSFKKHFFWDFGNCIVS